MAEATISTAEVNVDYVDGEAYEIAIRGHRLRVDQPSDHGGADTAPTPTEVFVGSLASCVAFYAGRYLSRHGFDRDGLRVHADYTMSTDRPARVASIHLTILPPRGFPVERVPALTAVSAHCTVHNTIANEPSITITVG